MILSADIFVKKKSTADFLRSAVSRVPVRASNEWFAYFATQYLVNNPTGYYSSFEIEKYYIDLANQYHVELSSDYNRNTCLLVTVEVVETGGHTRVMERWIEADDSRQYSIALLGQDAKTISPDMRIARAVRKSGGKIFSVTGDRIHQGLELRKQSSRYETIVLFTYPWDVVHIIAFGSHEFKRPVGYFNAPDHMFWLGPSIADLCADFRRFGQELSLKYRGVKESVFVHVPASSINVPSCSRDEAKKILGIPREMKLIVSAARYTKYKLIDENEDILDQFRGILVKRQDVMAVCIGARESDLRKRDWHSNDWLKRVSLLGYVPHGKLLLYFRAADLLVDSFPFSGMTTMEDALMCGTPVVSRTKDIDWVVDSGAIAGSAQEIADKALGILGSKEVAARSHKVTMEAMLAYSGSRMFRHEVMDFLDQLANRKHSVCSYRSENTGLVEIERIRANEALSLTKGQVVLKYCFETRSFILSYWLYGIVWKFVQSVRGLRKSIKRGLTI